MEQKYIVGDIFMVDNQPRKVTWIGASFPRVEIDGVDVACKNSDLKPIPLTPEILEKNGWKENKGDYINDSNHLHLCGKYDGYSVYKVVNDYNVVWLTCVRNVSDLQHLLFGLGLNSEMEV